MNIAFYFWLGWPKWRKQEISKISDRRENEIYTFIEMSSSFVPLEGDPRGCQLCCQFSRFILKYFLLVEDTPLCVSPWRTSVGQLPRRGRKEGTKSTRVMYLSSSCLSLLKSSSAHPSTVNTQHNHTASLCLCMNLSCFRHFSQKLDFRLWNSHE